MAVKRVLQVLRRVTEFKEYVLVTFKEEGERLLSLLIEPSCEKSYRPGP